MREIKFRAWNHIVGRMTEKAYTLQELYVEKVNFTNLIFMQFTGLKDKNGTDIYEGDKLINPQGQTGIVNWYEGGFYLECNRKSGIRFHVILTRGFVANKLQVGNVYQN